MKAYQIKQYGAHEQLFLNEIVKPTLTPDKIMVKVSSARTVIYSDSKRRLDCQDAS